MMNIFDSIKRTDPDGVEYWSSRDLARALEYVDYRNFEEVIAKAQIACKNSRQPEDDHFVDVTEMIEVAKGAQRQIKSVFLSRYACYLIIQSADPKKAVVALGHSYFAMQTRRQELEDDRRLQLRQEMKEHNKELASAAKQAGVVEPIDYAIFQNFGYQGLYGGLRRQDIHQHKGLKKSQDILDHMGSEELAANLFRATQTEAKLRRDGTTDKHAANTTHFNVGQKIRKTIADFGNTMPEDLPTPDKSIKQLEAKKRKELKHSGNNREIGA
jgi:DNA-damage-inducible protein D